MVPTASASTAGTAACRIVKARPTATIVASVRGRCTPNTKQGSDPCAAWELIHSQRRAGTGGSRRIRNSAEHAHSTSAADIQPASPGCAAPRRASTVMKPTNPSATTTNTASWARPSVVQA